MAALKPFERDIKAFYRRSAFDLQMFGFIMGTRSALETISIKKAIEMYYSTVGLTEEDYPMQSAERTYYRMQKEFLEIFKQN